MLEETNGPRGACRGAHPLHGNDDTSERREPHSAPAAEAPPLGASVMRQHSDLPDATACSMQHGWEAASKPRPSY